jgi:hypothetical protein
MQVVLGQLVEDWIRKHHPHRFYITPYGNTPHALDDYRLSKDFAAFEVDSGTGCNCSPNVTTLCVCDICEEEFQILPTDPEFFQKLDDYIKHAIDVYMRDPS